MSWDEWTDHNIQRGCNAATMLSSMVASGSFDQAAAHAVLISHRHPELAALAPVSAALPAPERPYVYEAPHVFQGPRLHLQNRDIRAVLRIEKPQVVVLDGVLSSSECDRVIALARPKLAVSTVVDPETGAGLPHERRTSRGAYFARGETPFITRIEQRLSAVMGIPVEHGEGIQVLNYGIGGEYQPHYDYFPPEQPGSSEHTKLALGGQRISTLILYLNDVKGGGETIFPKLNLSVIPRKGQGLLFEYANSLGQLDALTYHGGAPVTVGEKWIATKWMHQHKR